MRPGRERSWHPVCPADWTPPAQCLGPADVDGVSRTEIAARTVTVIACTALAAIVLFVLKVGPVVATLTATHGIHAGDALAALPAAAAAWVGWPLIRVGRASGGVTGRRAAVMQ